MMKGLIIQQQNQLGVEENMSNLTSASGEASVCSGNRAETSAIYSQQYYNLTPPSQTRELPAVLKKKRNLPGNPDPEAEVIALSPKTLLATNRFVCEICNKGFQRDQNLQLHRRGHNLPWKLKKRTSKDVIRKKVYVCPEASCVHHDPSRALGDLTGIKKHFCRKHGEKKWKCEKCSKKYAVQSDWKAHSKTCGTREYKCDCGTLFSRRDSFITHRAFCDALAEESARAINTGTPLLSSQVGTSSSTSHINLQFQNQLITSHDDHLHGFPTKKEQQNSFSLRLDIPPWLACLGPPAVGAGPGPPPIDHTIQNSPSIFSARLDDQDHPFITIPENSNPSLGPTLHHQPYHPTASSSPHMSATALLQKAAQMGSKMSSCSKMTPSSSAAMVMRRSPRADHVVADSSGTHSVGFGLNLSSPHEMAGGFVRGGLAPFGNKAAAVSYGLTGLVSPATACAGTAAAAVEGGEGTGVPAPPPALLQDMMNSISSATGFHGSSFGDKFGGVLNSKTGVGFHGGGPSKATALQGGVNCGGGGGGSDGMTRDFLGLRPLSHSHILSIAGLANPMNTPHENQSQTQNSWQG